MTLPFDSWKDWVDHSSTESELEVRIRRAHRDAYRHETCSRVDCPDHPETITSDNPDGGKQAMNNTPHAHNAEHGKALEEYRLAQAALNLYVNNERNFGGSRMALPNRPEYQSLVADRDAARVAVDVADPKTPTKAEKVKK